MDRLMYRRLAVPCAIVLVIYFVLMGASCLRNSADATYNPQIDEAAFGGPIDNPYMPLTPGTTFVYEGSSDGEPIRNEVVVTHDTKTILGVECVVVIDTVLVDGVIAERTEDWFAQDRDGAVWYFGEASQDYEDGQPSDTHGSWEAGVDGAQPGIVMRAHPAVGDSYRQEYFKGEAEDMGKVLATDVTTTVPFGTFERVVRTEDWTPLEPDFVEHKEYAEGVGLILAVAVRGGDERVELVSVTHED